MFLPHKTAAVFFLSALAAGLTSVSGQEVSFSASTGVTGSLVRRQAAALAVERLQKAWLDFAERNSRGDLRPEPATRLLQPKILARPELETLYKERSVPFQEPEVIKSKDRKLVATLTVAMARNQIGKDSVYLRNYNGRLTGPTLRCQPGDTLYITLRNELPVEDYEPGAMDTLHNFNTTNLHTHGLHVSPSGISDNVLLQVGPGSEQKYVIEIPGDHPCGSFWYHAHLHGSTAANVGSGMSGALIIEGGMDQVPEIAAAKERVMVLQQIPYVNNASKEVCDAIPADVDLSSGVVEAEYADCSFGPGTWDKLGRFTTINGQKLPVIKMRPGAVERWRLIDSAVREVIQPELVLQERSNPDAPPVIVMKEIAVDGLSLGRVADRTELELWPGYRSDVLVQAPMVKHARYILRDKRVPAKGAEFSEERRYLALVVVEGDPQEMKLPTDEQLKEFRPESLPASVTGQQVAAYGIIPKGKGVVFTVDRTPFGNDEARQVTLGEVNEWTLVSRNNVGPVSHPFHIHVNPFEIFSMVDENGVEQLDRDAQGKVIPLWRDTVILNEGWKVSCRTRYTDFTGVFVQHCHILDHEDQGMMELVEIQPPPKPQTPVMAHVERPSPYPAPGWNLPDENGKLLSLQELVKQPTLLVFFEGFGCLRCNEQIQRLGELQPVFQKKGLQIVAVSTDTVHVLAKELKDSPCPFPMVADPQMFVFRAYGCMTNTMPMHGVFLLDDAANVRWQKVSRLPFEDFDSLLARDLADLRTAGKSRAASVSR